MRRGNLPTGTLHSILRNKSETYKVTREVGETTNSLGEVEKTTKEIELNAYFYANRKRQIQRMTGEVEEGSLQGLANNEEDWREDDEVSVGGTEYEVTGVEGQPNDNNPEYKLIVLSKL